MKKRIISAVLAVIISFCALGGRIYSIMNSPKIVSAQSDIRVRELGTKRGTVYDRNGEPLVNRATKTAVCVIPSTKTNVTVKNIKGEKFAKETIMKGYMTTFILDRNQDLAESEDIKTFKTYERYSDNVALHLLGYCNSDKSGVCGVEKYFENEISSGNGKLEIAYSADAFGRVLTAEPIEIRNDNYYSDKGIALTIDRNFQIIVEKALRNGNIDKGAAVVLDVNNGAVLACASTPTYERENLSDYLSSDDSPFLNRALCAYPVGSVFKPVTAAAALESGIVLKEFECTGNIEKNGNIFNCSKTEGHGLIDFNTAVAFSCNPYFIELSTLTTPETLLNTAIKLGFSQKSDFGNGFVSDSGSLPDIKELNSDAAIGNLGFGQGKLTATPLQIAACFAVFANGGTYYKPYIFKGTVNENGSLTPAVSGKGEKVLKKSTCEIISKALSKTTLYGTGKQAYSSLFNACTKTATAQSGQYDSDGNEIKYCWFAGYFPYENPEYVICILKENGNSGGTDGAPVFKEISEKIYISEFNR